mmetsp:Transcript_24419/g.61804  ORF Transcript_24419/g.61804 Transcript_24419/m.61804 type:complete len:206 (-) Transcript_24419:522-1139(-)
MPHQHIRRPPRLALRRTGRLLWVLGGPEGEGEELREEEGALKVRPLGPVLDPLLPHLAYFVAVGTVDGHEQEGQGVLARQKVLAHRLCHRQLPPEEVGLGVAGALALCLEARKALGGEAAGEGGGVARGVLGGGGVGVEHHVEEECAEEHRVCGREGRSDGRGHLEVYVLDRGEEHVEERGLMGGGVIGEAREDVEGEGAELGGG